MSGLNHQDSDFINKITAIIEENISNEYFGVSELARLSGMSRSSLLRKIRSQADMSASQFIRNVRLKYAMELLNQQSLNVSEVSYRVGFSSTSYFIKCFREYYGYPPGEAAGRNTKATEPMETAVSGRKTKNLLIAAGSVVGILILVLAFYFKPFSSDTQNQEKSIAVLPFINDSNDSTNVYIINGLMESVLNDLQKIGDMRVISRTSVEKFRNTRSTIPEMGRELNVNYFVEGSGQKIGDRILLSIQLIDAHTDKHLWSEQYTRETNDIFRFQREVAKNIAAKIQAVITPEEAARIDKIPTDNPEAYDLFLKGLDFFHMGTAEGLVKAIGYFKQAVALDSTFARAYADIAISYYYLDINQAEKKFTSKINENADLAMFFDPELPQALVAKSLYFMNNREYEKAVPYLEKAHEYSPNSAFVINLLSDFYTNYIPNTAKYLEYALKGIRLDIGSNDSATASFIYLHVGNAFIQSGFVDEAEKYIDKSLEYNPNNLFSEYVKAYILYARDGDLQRTKELLIRAYNKDTTRLDILQEIGKTCYYMRDYINAYSYYSSFIKARDSLHLDIYTGEDAKIGLVFNKMGKVEKSATLFNAYKKYADNDQTVYKHLSLAMYYSFHNDETNALRELRMFAKQDNFPYWITLFLPIDPLVDNIKELPEFNEIMKDIEMKFQENHQQIKVSLESQQLLSFK
ncbi:MAG TPA: helix-turn-helix domain-containing protein [Bacteroidales bacterium]|nr:helix-turn-helix domain-containing protein [Bacteroidales bacterium]